MSDHTRADEGEGREPGQDYIREQRDAAMASVARLTAAIEMNAREVASVGLPDEAKWVLAAKDQWQRRAMAAEARAAQAEAEVARLTAALAEAERERNDAEADADLHAAQRAAAHRAASDFKSSASALRERVATLEAALQPFATYAADMPGADFGEGEIGEYYHDGFRRSIRTQDLRAARTALEAPHAKR